MNDAELCSLARAEADRLLPGGRGSLLSLGKLKAQWLLSRPGWYALPAWLPFLGLGETSYHPPRRERGMASAQAAVLDRTVRLAPDEIRARGANAQSLLASLESLAAVTPVRAPVGCTAGWLRLPVLAPPGAWQADRRTRRLGIMPGYPLPLTRLPGFGSRAEGRTGAMPGAERLARELMTLPVHSWVADQDLVGVRARLAAVLDPRPGS